MLKLLAEKVNLTPGAASIIVDTLVKQGVLDRRTSDVDGRPVCIGLSEEGKRIVACYGGFCTGVTGEFLAGCPREEYEIMMKLLNQFNDKILRMEEENEAQ
ncbi:MAG: MarR family transcriptional regulator [Victivallales bacterium]